MLRSKGLTEKLLMLGIDGMDPRFTRRLVDGRQNAQCEKNDGVGCLP